jgi:hypothetical protein
MQLSYEECEELISRLGRDTWSAGNRRVVAQVLWIFLKFLFALQESNTSLKRLRMLVFGKRPL